MSVPAHPGADLGSRLSLRFSDGTRWLERALALLVLLGVLVSAVSSAATLAQMDWRTSEAFYGMVYRVLLLVIGIELARMLVTHELRSVLELLAFVIARKMLKPDLTSLDIVLNVVAFVALLAAGRWMVGGRGMSQGVPARTDEEPSADRPAGGKSGKP